MPVNTLGRGSRGNLERQQCARSSCSNRRLGVAIAAVFWSVACVAAPKYQPQVATAPPSLQATPTPSVTVTPTPFPAASATAVSSDVDPDERAITQSLEPAGKYFSHFLYILYQIVQYVVAHPSIAALIAAGVAARMALSNIKVTRSIAKTKETFALLNNANFIKARNAFSEVKTECADNPQAIAIYAYPFKAPQGVTAGTLDVTKLREEHKIKAGFLRSVLNDYENMALGVKHNIIDEKYLYKSMKTNMINDWKRLSPLIYTYRDRAKSHTAFVEFEGLVYSWENEGSYFDGTPMSPTIKHQIFR
jgi:hypothetical protein